jgi:predicted PurR-regulated permease PerM
VLLLGGSLFGFYGLLLSIPAVAAASVVVRRGVEHYRNSEFFTRESDEVELDPTVAAPMPDVAESQTGEGE